MACPRAARGLRAEQERAHRVDRGRRDHLTRSLILVPPSSRYRGSYLRALRAWRDEGLAWHLAVDLDAIERDFDAFVRGKLAEAEPTDPSGLPKTQLWAVADGEIVGRIGILHRLTEALYEDGGHIGYDTVPAHRGRGVATEMLRQALPYARSLGIGEVRLTCDETNAASARVIEKLGGLREPAPSQPRLPAKRAYTIVLDERHVHAIDDLVARAVFLDTRDEDHDDDHAYWNVVRLLQERDVAAVWDAIVPLADDADPRKRALVPNTLRYLGGRPQPRLAETVALLRLMLASPQSDEVLVAIATAFVDLWHPAALELLRPLIPHASPAVRHAVIAGLLPIANAALPELITLSRDPVATVREWATFGLGSQIPAWSDPGYVDDPARRAALWDRHDDADEDARGEALVGLAAMQDPRALALIEQALAVTDDPAGYALEAAEVFADPRLAGALMARRAGGDGSDELARAIMACGAG